MLQDKRGTKTESQSLVQLRNSFPPLSSKALPHLDPVMLAIAFIRDDEGAGGCWNWAPEPFPFRLLGAWPAFQNPLPERGLLHQVTVPLGQPLCHKRMPPTSLPTQTSEKRMSRVGVSVGSPRTSLCTPNLISLPTGLTSRVHPSNPCQSWLPGAQSPRGHFWLIFSQGCIVFPHLLLLLLQRRAVQAQQNNLIS